MTTTNHVPRTFDQVEVLPPDVLVIDVAVGERAGWDLLDRLHAEASTNSIPVLVTSTDPRLLERARTTARRHGPSAFLVKPFDLETMLGVIQELIGPARPSALPRRRAPIRPPEQAVGQPPGRPARCGRS